MEAELANYVHGSGTERQKVADKKEDQIKAELRELTEKTRALRQELRGLIAAEAAKDPIRGRVRLSNVAPERSRRKR